MTYHQLAIEVALRIRPNKAKTNAIVILCNKQIEVLHDTAPPKLSGPWIICVSC